MSNYFHPALPEHFVAITRQQYAQNCEQAGVPVEGTGSDVQFSAGQNGMPVSAIHFSMNETGEFETIEISPYDRPNEGLKLQIDFRQVILPETMDQAILPDITNAQARMAEKTLEEGVTEVMRYALFGEDRLYLQPIDLDTENKIATIAFTDDYVGEHEPIQTPYVVVEVNSEKLLDWRITMIKRFSGNGAQAGHSIDPATGEKTFIDEFDALTADIEASDGNFDPSLADFDRESLSLIDRENLRTLEFMIGALDPKVKKTYLYDPSQWEETLHAPYARDEESIMPRVNPDDIADVEEYMVDPDKTDSWLLDPDFQ